MRLYEHERAEARRGLVYGPNLTASSRCTLTTAVGGACTKARRRYSRPRPDPYRSPRGVVRDFSRKSRTRLQQTLCAMPKSHVGTGVLFVTLTYPAAYPGDWRRWKRQLDTWIKRLRRKFPRAAGVWKLEPQRRGAPHFHLIVIGVPFMAKQWVSETWYEVVGSHDARHLAAGTNVQLARSHRGVLSYAAKYVTKRQSLPADWQDGVGRWWGVFNRERLGITWQEARVSEGTYWGIIRCLRRLIAVRSGKRDRGPPRSYAGGMWAVLDDAQAVRVLACALRHPSAD